MALRNVPLLLALCSAGVSLAQVVVAPCTGSSSQLWSLDTSGADTTVQQSSDGPPVCLKTLSCTPAANDDTVLSPCGAPKCSQGLEQLWALDATGRLSSRLQPSLCLTLQQDGPAVNLWHCSVATSNMRWAFEPAAALLGRGGPATGQLRTLDAKAGGACLTRAAGPATVAVINASLLGLPLWGVGGLAAIGGARLIYEYPAQQRRDILDLLFNTSGGTAFQVLKTEIEGDVDSSYGSGPSFRHSRGEAASFARGIYLPWLLGEAKARNAAIGTYALAWGLPAWVGNGTFLSDDSVQYHLDYHTGVRDTYGYSFDLTGIHNERAWSLDFVIKLRTALDAAGFNRTVIAVNDASNSGCTDCPSAWGDDSITTALARNATFAAALGAIGLHGTTVLPKSPYDWERAGKIYLQSETNNADGALIPTVDGSFPQWAPNPGSSIGPGLEWPQQFLLNYLTMRITGLVICPLSHAWTWNYGRHNHGTALFIEPWSGYYNLGAAFWTQAHFTQATRPGWHFLEGTATGTWGSSWLVYATLVSPTLDAFSVVAVNANANLSAPLSLQLVGALAATFAGTTLATWTSDSSALFVQKHDTPVAADGTFSFNLPPRSVLTLTTLRTLHHAELAIPPRAPFPVPHVSNFAAQRMEEPGRLLSDLYGAFYVAPDPLSQRGGVLKQAVPANPGTNSWLHASRGGEGLPFTSLPTPGTAFANGNVSAAVLITAADLPPSGALAAVSVCGRVPIWQPAAWISNATFLGVCLTLYSDASWSVLDTTITGGSRTIASGPLPGTSPPAVGAWHTLALAFVDDTVAVLVDGILVQSAAGLRSASGAYGLGSRFHVAYFDSLRLDATSGHGRTPGSWLYDVLPGEVLTTNFTGRAGFVIDLTAPGTLPLVVSALGRFRARGNSRSHALDVIDAATGVSVLAGGAVTVDMSPAGCPATDLLGFCYAALPNPATLAAGGRFYVVSSEAAGGDAFVTITDAAAATNHVHRDGTTLMSYAGPLRGAVAGRVSQAAGGVWLEDGTIELMHGPLNLVLLG